MRKQWANVVRHTFPFLNRFKAKSAQSNVHLTWLEQTIHAKDFDDLLEQLWMKRKRYKPKDSSLNILFILFAQTFCISVKQPTCLLSSMHLETNCCMYKECVSLMHHDAWSLLYALILLNSACPNYLLYNLNSSFCTRFASIFGVLIKTVILLVSVSPYGNRILSKNLQMLLLFKMWLLWI